MGLIDMSEDIFFAWAAKKTGKNDIKVESET